MNKKEFVAYIAKKAGLTLSKSEEALKAMVDGVKATLKKKDRLILIGFGTFSVKKRSARKGRNPQTGKPLNIPAKHVPSFKAGRKLKDSIK
jgi:DNA-binding protein HU-beta